MMFTKENLYSGLFAALTALLVSYILVSFDSRIASAVPKVVFDERTLEIEFEFKKHRDEDKRQEQRRKDLDLEIMAEIKELSGHVLAIKTKGDLTLEMLKEQAKRSKETEEFIHAFILNEQEARHRGE